MILNIGRRLERLEGAFGKRFEKHHSSVFFKIGGEKYVTNPDYNIKPPTRERCESYGRRNIEVIKKQRIAREGGSDILKWKIFIV